MGLCRWRLEERFALGWRQKTAGSRQMAAVLSSHRDSRHVAAASLGQDAALSFVVIGRGRFEILDCRLRIWELENYRIRECVD